MRFELAGPVRSGRTTEIALLEERWPRLLLAGLQASLKLHPPTQVPPHPPRGPTAHGRAAGEASLAASHFQGPLLRDVNAIYRSMCRIMASLNICFHLQFPSLFFFLVPLPPRTCWVAGWEAAVSSPNKANPKILLMKICSCSWDLATACGSW